MKGQQATEHQKQPALDDNDDDRYTKAWKLYWISRKEKKLPVPLPRSPFPLAPITKLGNGRTPPTNFILFFKGNFEKENKLFPVACLSFKCANCRRKSRRLQKENWRICAEKMGKEGKRRQSQKIPSICNKKRFSIKFTDGLNHSSCQMMSPEEVLTIGGKICLKLDK